MLVGINMTDAVFFTNNLELPDTKALYAENNQGSEG
jgi:hypothetical protein